jgi:hypothetical protein
MSRAANHMSEVIDGGALDRLVEVALHVAGLQVTDVGAEPLDGADARERRHQGLPYTRFDQQARLREVREVVRPRLERDVDDVAAEVLGVLALPCLDGGNAVLRAR